MRNICVLLLLCACPILCRAQKDVQYPKCLNTVGTQYELDLCADPGAQQQEHEIKRVYAQLLSKVAADPNATAKVRAMERAWIAYRDAYLEATYPAKDKQAEYGTIFPMEFDNLRAELTSKQIDALKRLLHSDESENQ